MVLHDKLLTKDRLGRFGIITDGKCAFCDNMESLDHLLFYCETTKVMWDSILAWLGYKRKPIGWTNEKLWVIDETKKKGWKPNILKMVVVETVMAFGEVEMTTFLLKNQQILT